MLGIVGVFASVEPFHSGGDVGRFIVGLRKRGVNRNQPCNRGRYENRRSRGGEAGSREGDHLLKDKRKNIEKKRIKKKKKKKRVGWLGGGGVVGGGGGGMRGRTGAMWGWGVD